MGKGACQEFAGRRRHQHRAATCHRLVDHRTHCENVCFRRRIGTAGPLRCQVWNDLRIGPLVLGSAIEGSAQLLQLPADQRDGPVLRRHHAGRGNLTISFALRVKRREAGENGGESRGRLVPQQRTALQAPREGLARGYFVREKDFARFERTEINRAKAFDARAAGITLTSRGRPDSVHPRYNLLGPWFRSCPSIRRRPSI